TGKFALVGGSAGADWTFAGRAEESKVATGNRVRKKTLLAPYVMIALALIGVVDAFYDSYMIYTDQLLWCPPPIDGCNVVASSPYARIFGVPLGYFGLVYYLYMFALAALLAWDPSSRSLRVGVLAYAAVGVLLSLCFMYIQFTFIRAFCI